MKNELFKTIKLCISIKLVRHEDIKLVKVDNLPRLFGLLEVGTTDHLKSLPAFSVANVYCRVKHVSHETKLSNVKE